MPTECINGKRCEQAARLLLERRTSVAGVCYACGFGNASQFYTCFKQCFGVAPRAFGKARFG